MNWAEKVWSGLNGAFSSEIRAYNGSVADFLTIQSPDVHPIGRIFFHLVESKKEDYPFAFLATYSSGVASNGRSRHLPLKNALIEYKNDNKKLLDLLSTVNKASQKSELISGFVDSGEIFHPLGLTGDEAYAFLKEIPLYEESGILCRIPDWWRNRSNSLKVSISIGNKTPSRLGFDALVDFYVQLSIGNESMSLDELRKLLSETEGLAFIKGKWVEVDHEKLKAALMAYEQAQKLIGKTDMSIVNAMRFELNASEILNISAKACEVEVTNGETKEWSNVEITLKEDIHIGDEYIINGQARAVGPNTHAHDITFNPIWGKLSEEVDLKALSQELSALRAQLKKAVTEPAQDTDIGCVAAAETEAEKGNGEKSLNCCQKRGNGSWTLRLKSGRL